MSMFQFDVCPISGKPIKNPKLEADHYHYEISINDITYIFHLGIYEGWEKEGIISNEEKNVVRGLLHNNEWPIEPETIITPGLIRNIMRFAKYPRTFDEKLDYYLLKSYLNGGREYKAISFDITHALDIYAFNDDEYVRLMSALKSKNLILLPDNGSFGNRNKIRKFTLSEKGLQLGETLNKTQISLNPKKFSKPAPTVTIYACKEDSFYTEKLQKLLLNKFGISVSVQSDMPKSGYADILNSRNDLYFGNQDYVIFIKSKNSDKNNTFGSILEIAFESHLQESRKQFDYLYFAFIDDSDFDARARLMDYNNRCFDFRIDNQRTSLISLIQSDWAKLLISKKQGYITDRTYNFPKPVLKDGEEYWLKLLY